MSYKSSCKKSIKHFTSFLKGLIFFIGKGITTGRWEGKIEIKF